MNRRAILHTTAAVSAMLALQLLCGCSSGRLNGARSQYYAGQFAQAEEKLAEIPDNKDAVLLLMERGMIRHSTRNYGGSSHDWLDAVRRSDDLLTKSIGKQGVSLVSNDRALDFRGEPYERTLLHTFLAKNFLLEGKWQSAGVEGRNIIEHVQNLDDYPDDAYSRYMAGLCLQLTRDRSNAALQFRMANKLLSGIAVDERTGMIAPTNGPASKYDSRYKDELICFILIGRSPTGSRTYGSSPEFAVTPYANIRAAGKNLGRSYALANTAQLIAATDARNAVKQAAKDVARIAVKASIAHEIKEEDALLGELVEIFLFAMEAPDNRRWETLPFWLQVARVPCPKGLSRFEVEFNNGYGTVTRRKTVTNPITRKDRTYISICRDYP